MICAESHIQVDVVWIMPYLACSEIHIVIAVTHRSLGAAMTTTAHSADTDFDVIIIGAGISGIGAAHHLRTRRPMTSFAILEGREDIGGTWNLFKYPGIRSDSDM